MNSFVQNAFIKLEVKSSIAYSKKGTRVAGDF